jgi:hypothetical protein
MNVTSSPASDSLTPTYPPIAPAPMIAIFTEPLLLDTFDSGTDVALLRFALQSTHPMPVMPLGIVEVFYRWHKIMVIYRAGGRNEERDARTSMAKAFGRWLPNLHIAMEIKSTETIKQAVIAGMGIGYLSAHTVTLERRVGSLVVLDVQGFPPMLHWYVVHRKNKRLPPVASAFKDFLLSEGAALIEKITRVTAASPARAKSRHPTK